jgi:hypothetical protein
MEYTYTSDRQEEMGFINKDKILSYVTEEQIFNLVFGYEPEEFVYVASPFRQDNSPSCCFARLSRNKLRFIDHADNYYPDCFEAVQDYFGLSSFYSTLKFIYERLIKGKDLEKVVPKQITSEDREDAPVVIHAQARWFTSNDATFWKPYYITRDQLIEDDVFAVKSIKLYNTRKGDFSFNANDLCYLYSGFESYRKKLYFPRRKTKRFISTCTKNDIGCLKHLPHRGKQLIITKSYKDCRVIRNTGRASIWLQSEGTVPDINILVSIVKRFDSIIVLYDNDAAGIKGALALCDIINAIYPRLARAVWLPENLNEIGISDSADMVKHRDVENLLSFFKSYLI